MVTKTGNVELPRSAVRKWPVVGDRWSVISRFVWNDAAHSEPLLTGNRTSATDHQLLPATKTEFATIRVLFPMTQSPLSDRMSSGELHAAVSLAIIFFLRMLGLFLLLPVFSPQAIDLEDAALKLVGIAAGAYGLTQALLQIPFGTLSDRFGRKPTITVGLLVFFLC